MNFDKLAEKLAADHLGTLIVRSVRVRTAGEIRHIKDVGPQKRKYIKDHNYQAKDLKRLTKVLWQVSVALGHLSSASSVFTRMKSVRISPDGHLGGRGYDRPIKDIRGDLYKSIEALASIQDTLHDEVNAEHWKPPVKELPPKEKKDVEEMLDDVDQIRADPEQYGEEEYEESIEADDEDAASAFDDAEDKEDDSSSSFADGEGR